MDVGRSPAVPAWNDGVENHPSVLVRRLHTSQPSRIFKGRTAFSQRVVRASLGSSSPAGILPRDVCVPDVDHGSSGRLASGDIDEVDFEGERDAIAIFGDGGAYKGVLGIEGSFE